MVRPRCTVTASLPLDWSLADADVTSTQGGGELADRQRVRDPLLQIEKLVTSER